MLPKPSLCPLEFIPVPFVFTEMEILFVLSEPNANLAPFSPFNAPAQMPVNVYAEG